MKNDNDDAQQVGRSYGTIPEDEHRLIVRGLDCLKLTLLDEAGGLAETKISRRKGSSSMEEVVAAGIERLEEIKTLNRLNKWLQARPQVRLK
jgi:hypothetical protein